MLLPADFWPIRVPFPILRAREVDNGGLMADTVGRLKTALADRYTVQRELALGLASGGLHPLDEELAVADCAVGVAEQCPHVAP